jgi:hypothetical protein
LQGKLILKHQLPIVRLTRNRNIMIQKSENIAWWTLCILLLFPSIIILRRHLCVDANTWSGVSKVASFYLTSTLPPCRQFSTCTLSQKAVPPEVYQYFYFLISLSLFFNSGEDPNQLLFNKSFIFYSLFCGYTFTFKPNFPSAKYKQLMLIAALKS